CPARVDAMDVVKTIADAELIVAAELMIHLGQEVAIVNRVWITARRDLRSFVAGHSKPGVDGVNVRGSDSDESALIQFTLLDVCEIESAVGKDRPSETRAVLRLRGRQFAVR